MNLNVVLAVAIGAALITILYVWMLFRRIKKVKITNKRVDEITGHIHDGAMAFLLREYKVIIPFTVIFAVALGVLNFVSKSDGSTKFALTYALATSGCLLVGALFSGLTGFIGMQTATKANGRTATKAQEEGMSGALKVAFSGGAVLGLSVCAFGLGGLAILMILAYLIGNSLAPDNSLALSTLINVVTGYGLGCSLIALFGRVGGGIYTKAADVGADLVGKVEAGIPEDDPRNPAVIADNVGDNVGDIAGMASDLTESYVGSITSALTLAVLSIDKQMQLNRMAFVLLIAAIGAIASVIAVIIVRNVKSKDPHKALDGATYIASAIVLVASLILSIVLFKNGVDQNWKVILPFIAITSGLASGVIIGKIAEIYTSEDYKSVKEIAHQSQTGHATNVIAGFSVGMKSTAPTIAVVAIAIAIAYLCGNAFGDNGGMYGIALAAVGMLSTVGITVSVDGYGPISDNAGGIAQMSGLPEHVREITDKLDAVGNTTAAIGKGFSIGSATLTALALFASFANAANLQKGINLLNPNVIIGVVIGGMLPFLFTALTTSSVGKAANKMIEEVRRQFKEKPGILDGKETPDYATCVDISTKASLKEMVVPAIIAIASPILSAVILGLEGLAGVLLGSLISGIMLAIFMNNAGGAWDNAKKYIESGQYGGKGSPAHKAAVTGDTVGDPFKDTSGPALNILIKLMTIVALVIAPVFLNWSEGLWGLLK